MATNRVYEHGWRKAFVPDNPDPAVIGGIVRTGKMVGVALTAPDANGMVTIDFHGVYDLPVFGDDGSGSPVAIGDLLYFTDSSGQLDKDANDVPAGIAWERLAQARPRPSP